MGGVEMDTQSCIDHSILAIFEDSSVSSEVRVKAITSLKDALCP